MWEYMVGENRSESEGVCRRWGEENHWWCLVIGERGVVSVSNKQCKRVGKRKRREEDTIDRDKSAMYVTRAWEQVDQTQGGKMSSSDAIRMVDENHDDEWTTSNDEGRDRWMDTNRRRNDMCLYTDSLVVDTRWYQTRSCRWWDRRWGADSQVCTYASYPHETHDQNKLSETKSVCPRAYYKT